MTLKAEDPQHSRQAESQTTAWKPWLWPATVPANPTHSQFPWDPLLASVAGTPQQVLQSAAAVGVGPYGSLLGCQVL